MFKVTFAQLVWFSIFAIMLGCSKTNRFMQEAEDQQILHIGNHASPRTLDPQQGSIVPEMRIYLALYEGLIQLHPQTLTPEPGLAASWEVSGDGLTYVFHLRSEARFSNGDPVYAEDFVRSYERLLSASSLSAHGFMLDSVEGARAYRLGELQNFEAVGIRAIDAYTLEIKLLQPVPYFLTLLAHHAFVPLHASMRHNGFFHLSSIIGTGPFMIQPTQERNFLALEKNPYYWNASKVHLNAIYFHPIESTHTEEQAFLAGQLHITSSVAGHRVQHYQQVQSPALRIYPYWAVDFYFLNVQQPPLNDVRVRQALSLSLDREVLVNGILRRGQLPAYRLVPSSSDRPWWALQEDVRQAQALLAEAGYPGGKGFPRLKLIYNTSQERQLVAQAVQAMWKENLGIEIILENQEAKAFFSRRSQGDFDLCRGGWVGDFCDPVAFLDLFQKTSAFNFGHWESSHYDELLHQAHQFNGSSRLEALEQAEAYWLTQLPAIPLFFMTSSALVHSSVRGYFDNILDYHPYVGMYLDSSQE